MKSVGFKEWAIVCEALGRGEQCVILRKGGIAEGRAGFSFQHEEFFLFPTLFHEQVEKTRTLAAIPVRNPGEIPLRYFAKVERAAVIRSWDTVAALEPFHILRQSVVRERFDYDGSAAIHVAYVRVSRLSVPWVIPDLPAYGGCRSWVNLPELPPDCVKTTVLDSAEHSQRFESFLAVLATSDTPPALSLS